MMKPTINKTVVGKTFKDKQKLVVQYIESLTFSEAVKLQVSILSLTFLLSFNTLKSGGPCN